VIGDWSAATKKNNNNNNNRPTTTSTTRRRRCCSSHIISMVVMLISPLNTVPGRFAKPATVAEPDESINYTAAVYGSTPVHGYFKRTECGKRMIMCILEGSDIVKAVQEAMRNGTLSTKFQMCCHVWNKPANDTRKSK
jgi:hypothetical protein